jgi:hypothetical protein
MTHLWIAHHVAGPLGVVNRPAFLLGNLAPDAIHMRPGWTRDAKRRLHLTTASKRLDQRIAAAVAFYAANRQGQPDDFLLGDVTHLLADDFWSHLLGRYFHHVYAQTMPPEASRALYYGESTMSDALLFREAPFAPSVCDALRQAGAPDAIPFLSPTEVLAWRSDVLAKLATYPRRPRRPLRYFSQKLIHAYLDICIGEIPDILFSAQEREHDFRALAHRYPEHALAHAYIKAPDEDRQ